ncbi:MAG: hypothetical protein JST89_24325 [Cyanobacteria bacterium SZAS-4]|nr:hypothetical protein [Cyanobacteria bacterium SZAS-4]
MTTQLNRPWCLGELNQIFGTADKKNSVVIALKFEAQPIRVSASRLGELYQYAEEMFGISPSEFTDSSEEKLAAYISAQQPNGEVVTEYTVL